jgi:hypothetical protein
MAPRDTLKQHHTYAPRERLRGALLLRSWLCQMWQGARKSKTDWRKATAAALARQ